MPCPLDFSKESSSENMKSIKYQQPSVQRAHSPSTQPSKHIPLSLMGIKRLDLTEQRWASLGHYCIRQGKYFTYAERGIRGVQVEGGVI
jgi:hypothetical protein